MSELSTADVAHLARLARLALTDDEIAGYTTQLGAILDHVSRIQALDTGDVPPTGNPLKEQNVTRPDVVTPSLPQADALAAAPAVADGRFAVPQILGEEA
ncbi:Asp-tRNA(Asn)/Glu-tRNA(Gln) amidotransferase subunit GatC [Mycobacterium sp. MYCO198283]|uniref:Asp-tRNA(Asn)/Glu-tRNA(Gln) amidotransferase subunit GatC n=1 Tax=Mycobacterium sp. MYCO198283 TaxID=2883505 RepID=UPI001E593C46|nr:Asp-tRNA(Asn)/Glu-tRNA(Gln) amidotransferase subunit GatC [Mycobacterium sp. MYCO198283]MCG5434378.1 Asp-tRNA(Asn)/Glu-tRNA(Gln) amidotransferase subunit GatC [Mycobacterium sp. MYCO198283]